MRVERVTGGSCRHPFPVYPQLVDTLAAAHVRSVAERDRTVAHVLGTCAGYAYSDADTMSMMMTRLGLERHACVGLTQVVDAMFIFSTAYLVQSRCGRVVILCYRGTEPSSLGNWLGDADVGKESSTLSLADGAERLRVHAGFHRNMRATLWPVLEELRAALAGRSLANHDVNVECPLEALYVTGHSLGAAMALLFALTVCGNATHAPIGERLRAVYTFGQPMAVAGVLSPAMASIGTKVLRHITPLDPVPTLPPAGWGSFTHVGQEYRFLGGEWRRSETPVEQMTNLRDLLRSLVAFFAAEARRRPFRFTIGEHAPDHYIAALRPADRVTEFGD
jgi:hypothetical protein